MSSIKKAYVCDCWCSLDDIGEHVYDRRCYLSREDAERRAKRLTHSEDGIDYHARVVELDLCAKPTREDRLIAERNTWYLHALDLRDENAKLRELVRDMWPHVRHRSRMCGKCELPCDTSDECLLYEPMRQRMRELGIEVEQ